MADRSVITDQRRPEPALPRTAAPGRADAPPAPAAAGRNRAVRLLIIGTVLALLALLVDQPVTNLLTNDPVHTWLVKRFLEPLAGAAVFILPGVILCTYSNRRRLLVGYITPQLVATLVTHLVKWGVGRARPYTDLGPHHFQAFSWLEDFRTFAFNGRFESFPSGHASAAAALALLLGLYYPRARWIFYVMALLIGAERIINDRHFLSDVLAGFVVGGLAVYACHRQLGRRYYDLSAPGK